MTKKEAEVLTNSKGNKLPTKDITKNAIDSFKRKISNSGNTVLTVAKISKDYTLYTMYNNVRQARQAAEYMLSEAQTDVTGNKVGESLKDIFEPIRKKWRRIL